MKIREIHWKNFGSYGNKLQTLEFDSNQGNFYLVLGKNGSGKSSTSDVIKFGLYGKVDNKKLKDIPNRFNNNTYVKIVVEKNPNTIVTIERGIAPGFFKLFINGIEYDQAGKKNMQEYLEEEILGIPFYVFNNMISLSINDFKSFISMGVNDKRQIIDRLFGLEILSHIKWKVKYKIKVLKDYLDNIDTEINVLERSIQKSVSELEALNEKIKAADEEKKTVLLESIEKYNQYVEKANLKLQEIKEKEINLNQVYRELTAKIHSSQAEEKTYKQKIHLYESGKCPTCESDLTTDSHKSIYNDYLEKDKNIQILISELKEKVNVLKDNISKLGNMYSEVNDKKITADTHLQNCKKEYRQLQESGSTDMESNSLQNIIEDSKEKRKEAIHKKNDEEKKNNFFKILEDIFGDKGVKLSALKRIVPVLNTEIKKVLLDLNLDYRVSFNEEFDVDIQFLGFTVVPEQLSTGERKKIDFAVLIALIRLMKIRFSGLNLIFLDEIFSSIDSESIYGIVQVLHKTCKELNLNTFVINHSQLPNELFDYIIRVEKNNGFSNLSLEKND